ncbi:RNA-directed DNA polymerase, eukaryota, reverse transcriptase zinc-binding domain protein [Tanacetum coccineum]
MKFFCTIVYASNSGHERKRLWHSLGVHRQVVNGISWVILGDFNVTLNVNEHSNGSSVSSAYMIDFQKCVADLEIEDILSSGFQFTWTKSLKDPEYKNPFDDTIKKQSCEVLREYTEAARDEENLMIQKAKVDWLKGGDRNTDFFHKIIKGSIHKGRVMSICDENGMRYENEKVAEQFEKHFKKFLGTKDEVCAFPNGCIVVNNKLNSDEAMRMARPINDKEIRDAMFVINDSKAPSPDGFTAKFFKATWKIIGKDKCMAVRDFFLTGKLLGEVNVTLISLVLKIPTLGKVSDFRPIACYNVLYKCISKIMTNRIKEVLGKIVNENQSAFIAGRQITDNILLAQELFRGYNRKQKVKKLPLDLSKDTKPYIKLRSSRSIYWDQQVVSELVVKLTILNPGEYDLWLMKIEQYFLMTDYSFWEVILNGNKVLKRTTGETEKEYEPTTVEEKQDMRNEMKAKGTLLMALPNKDQLK